MTNNMFQQGNFDGYKVRGRCKVVKEYEHQIENFSNRLKKPGSGKFMAILDDPALIEEPDGVRVASNKVPSDYAEKDPVELIDKRGSGIEEPIYKIPTSGGLTTASKDGAYIEINHSLDIGSGIRIRWDFLIGESSENDFALNDFALVDIIDTKTNSRVYCEVLQQTTDIPLGRWSTGWRSFTWQSPKKFKAKLRIIVCNGYSYSDSNPPTLDQFRAARSFPSGLLIDCVSIV